MRLERPGVLVLPWQSSHSILLCAPSVGKQKSNGQVKNHMLAIDDGPWLVLEIVQAEVNSLFNTLRLIRRALDVC